MSLSIKPEVIRKTKELGLNLSKVCENALTKAIKALEKMDQPKELKLTPVSEEMVDWAGFEPAASALPRRRSYQTDLPAPI